MMVVVKPEYPNCDSAAFGRHDAPEVEQKRPIVIMCRVMMMMRLVGDDCSDHDDEDDDKS